MTDTTAPRTAADLRTAAITSLHHGIREANVLGLEDVTLPLLDAIEVRDAAIEAEAIEPLLALVRRFLDARQALMDYRGGSDEHYLDQLGRELIHAEAELRAALPESVRVAARKPE